MFPAARPPGEKPKRREGPRAACFSAFLTFCTEDTFIFCVSRGAVATRLSLLLPGIHTSASSRARRPQEGREAAQKISEGRVSPIWLRSPMRTLGLFGWGREKNNKGDF